MNKVKLLIVGLIIINIILISVVLINRSTPENPAPQNQPTSTQSLNVVSLNPILELLLDISSGTPLTIVFDQDLDQSSIAVLTDPLIETTLVTAGNELIIKPKTYWPTDQEIKITILTARGLNGAQMKNPYEFVIKSPKPTF